MKAVLMSIHPKWCELIFSGEKTIEVRKTAPKLEVPFKVYMYETLGKRTSCRQCDIWQTCDLRSPFGCHEGAGAVVGEFVCDFVKECIPDFCPYHQVFFNYFFESGNDCLTEKERRKYGNGSSLYGLYITEAKRYDTPKELYEFTKACDFRSNCGVCTRKKYLIEDGIAQFMGCDQHIYRAPQSWCYVHEVQND